LGGHSKFRHLLNIEFFLTLIAYDGLF
jgi:hypothetical protein